MGAALLVQAIHGGRRLSRIVRRQLAQHRFRTMAADSIEGEPGKHLCQAGDLIRLHILRDVGPPGEVRIARVFRPGPERRGIEPRQRGQEGVEIAAVMPCTHHLQRPRGIGQREFFQNELPQCAPPRRVGDRPRIVQQGHGLLPIGIAQAFAKMALLRERDAAHPATPPASAAGPHKNKDGRPGVHTPEAKGREMACGVKEMIEWNLLPEAGVGSWQCVMCVRRWFSTRPTCAHVRSTASPTERYRRSRQVSRAPHIFRMAACAD